MKTRHCIWLKQSLLLGFGLLFQISASGQFVKLTAEIELNDWDYPFFIDRMVEKSATTIRPQDSIFRKSGLVHCVVGTNTWLIEVPAEKSKRIYWFTGTNLIQYAESALVGGAVQKSCVIHETTDGNPGRPVRVADLMTFDPGGRFCWLAFCSGPFLRKTEGQIYPPSDLWKQSALTYSGWTNQTKQFADALGLPRSLDLIATNHQPIFQYQARHTTNFLGWTFPMEFYGVQYLPFHTNLWKLHLTIKGRVLAIEAGEEPRIPEADLKSAKALSDRQN